MTGYDFDRPYLDAATLPIFRATDPGVAVRYGATVKAAPMSNSEYAIRHARLAASNNMQPPPKHGRIFPGYLVIRRIGTTDQYETWIPEHVFDEMYGPLQ